MQCPLSAVVPGDGGVARPTCQTIRFASCAVCTECASQSCASHGMPESASRGQGPCSCYLQPHSLTSQLPLPRLPPTPQEDKHLTRRDFGFALGLPALSSPLLLSISAALAGESERDGAEGAASSREGPGAEAEAAATDRSESLSHSNAPCMNDQGPFFDYRIVRGALATGPEEEAISLEILVPLDVSPSGDTRALPLAIFSGGFGLDSAKYGSYVKALATSGFVAMSYDERSAARVARDDLSRATLLSSLIDWCASSDDLNGLADVDCVYLCGHSRGVASFFLLPSTQQRLAARARSNWVSSPSLSLPGAAKISILAAATDHRVVSLGLLDPVDNTDYAPLAPGYPSAVAIMEAGRRGMETTGLSTHSPGHAQDLDMQGLSVSTRDLKTQGLRVSTPSLIVGGGLPGDCAPRGSNYPEFFRAASSPSWQLVIRQAGHLQFVEDPPVLQNSVCGFGKVKDDDVRLVAEKALVAWGLATVVSRKKQVSQGHRKLDASAQTCLRSLTNTLNGMLPDDVQSVLL